MKSTIKIGGGLFLALAFLSGVIYWFEAEKEVRILCSIFNERQAAEQVQQTLDTGNLLYYEFDSEEIIVNSSYTLNTTECRIALSAEGNVVEAAYRNSFKLEWAAAVIGAFGTFMLAIFQLLLSLGLPFGEYAWGGRYKRLPTPLRAGSAISFLLLIAGGCSILSAVHLSDLVPAYLSEVSVYFFVVLFSMSIAGNSITTSEKERKVMLPLSYMLASSYLVVTVYLLG